MELYYLLFIIAALVYQLLNFKAVFAYSYRNEVICIDGFETNKKPGNQFQNKSLKAILFSSSSKAIRSSSLFNTSSPIRVYRERNNLPKNKFYADASYIFLLMTKHNFL